MRTIFLALIAALLAATLAAGQIYSPALADTPTGPTCKNTYIVRRGDSLLKIARLCSVTLDDLLAANPEITNGGLIYPGQILRIIAGSRIPDVGGTYTVESGDTLGTIAEQFNTTVKELLRLNPDILDPRFIYIGQVLVLPGKTSGPRVELLTGSVKPGGVVQVAVYGFPANTYIDYRAGVRGGPYTLIKDGVTDAAGYATANITIPTTADIDHPWEILVLTTEAANGVQAYSETITITH